LERATVGNVRAGSKGGARVFRLGYDDPEYVAMARTARPMWTELEAESGRALLSTTGQLSFGVGLDTLAAAMTAAGAPSEMMDAAEASRRVPGVDAGGPALFETESGVLAADQCLSALRRGAEAAGAEVRENAAVTSISDDGKRVHLGVGTGVGTGVGNGDGSSDDVGTVTASVAVVCAGHWTSGLLRNAGIGVRLVPTLEQVAYLAPVSGRESDITVFIERASPWVYGLPAGVPGLLKVAMHGAGPVAHPDDSPLDPDPLLLARLAEHTARLLPAHHVEPVTTERCFYDSTVDGDFVLDRVGRVVIGAGTTGHGFKFGPLLGEVLADLTAGSQPRVDVERFSAQRSAVAT
jgi:sarcosine oxidase